MLSSWNFMSFFFFFTRTHWVILCLQSVAPQTLHFVLCDRWTGVNELMLVVSWNLPMDESITCAKTEHSKYAKWAQRAKKCAWKLYRLHSANEIFRVERQAARHEQTSGRWWCWSDVHLCFYYFLANIILLRLIIKIAATLALNLALIMSLCSCKLDPTCCSFGSDEISSRVKCTLAFSNHGWAKTSCVKYVSLVSTPLSHKYHVLWHPNVHLGQPRAFYQ